MKHILGISAGFHDAALTLIDEQANIAFASHSERYSKIKNDADLCVDIVQETYGYDIDIISYYERPWLKQLRQWYSGQGIEWNRLTARQVLQQQLPGAMWSARKIHTHNHHRSHAAAGFQTSPYDQATVVVIDAVGEFQTITIWAAEYDADGRAQYRRLWQQNYPHSVGLFYSAITERVGLHPLDEEYITMGMAAWGQPQWRDIMRDVLVEDVSEARFKMNLHTGLDAKFLQCATDQDIAASAQAVLEQLIAEIMTKAKNFGFSSNLVYMGGVALNCLANRRLGEYFENIWIMPCPGDAGSSLGAAALSFGRRINWRNAYLGHDIPGDYPVGDCLDQLLAQSIVGVASGRAEFGPRALGNRSLLADPRGTEIKEKVNAIKRRQQFRPFAPVILEEHARDYFDMPRGWSDSRYMQIVGRCLRPDLFPAIVHVDNTSRIQTVPQDGSGIRALLEAWYAQTGCPMLLNTSLNIRGEPMVNDRADADRFEKLYGVRVCS